MYQTYLIDEMRCARRTRAFPPEPSFRERRTMILDRSLNRVIHAFIIAGDESVLLDIDGKISNENTAAKRVKYRSSNMETSKSSCRVWSYKDWKHSSRKGAAL